jgi:Sec-independent protein secretion pathway component TatC
MMIVWGPLVVLYFLGLGLALFAEKARGRRLAKNAEENS